MKPTFLREEFAPFLRCQLLRKRHFESSKQGETNSRNGDATKTINPKKANPATTWKSRLKKLIRNKPLHFLSLPSKNTTFPQTSTGSVVVKVYHNGWSILCLAAFKFILQASPRVLTYNLHQWQRTLIKVGFFW